MKRYTYMDCDLVESDVGEWVRFDDIKPPRLVEMDEDHEMIGGHFVPGGTLLLEPREMYDKALVGTAHQAGVAYAVYSRTKTLEAMIPEMGEEDAHEMYDFNTSGSIGVGFPVFLMDDEDVEW